jgi:protein-tyrosine phosphatase
MKKSPDADPTPATAKEAISFVCTGNICRSPTAEAVMRHLVADAGLAAAIEVDSAGTGSWHVGEERDRRTRAVASRRGMPIHGPARQFSAGDFQRFDLVLALDEENLRDLRRIAPNDGARAKIHLLREFEKDAEPGAVVPDPYYGGPEGFEHVFDICLAACRGLLEYLRTTYHLGT